jgi:hypothetical protein
MVGLNTDGTQSTRAPEEGARKHVKESNLLKSLKSDHSKESVQLPALVLWLSVFYLLPSLG